MKRMICAYVFGVILFVACTKKDPEQGVAIGSAGAKAVSGSSCSKEIITDRVLKIGETGVILPVGTRLCIGDDIAVELPAGYSYETNSPAEERSLPFNFATYHCICMGGGACQVAYTEGMGFGCFHSSCPGTCTGNFIYKGYSVNRVVWNLGTNDDLFNDEVILKFIEANYTSGSHELFGARFTIGNPEGASCDCEGTRACVIKTKTLSKGKLVYCDGPCNGCELTVNKVPVF